MLQQLQSAVQATGQVPPAVGGSVLPTPSLFIQLHHLVQLQQILQRLQLQQASAYAAQQQARLPRLPTLRPDPLAIKIAKIRQQIVALHLQIKQACRQQQQQQQQQVLSGAGGGATAATTHLPAPQDVPAFDPAHDLAIRDFPAGSMMIRDDLAAAWKSAAVPDSMHSSSTGTVNLPHSISQSLDTWPGWPPSLLTSPPPPDIGPTDGSEMPAAMAADVGLDIEEFIPGKPWQGPMIRSADDDPFITPGGASVDDQLRSIKTSSLQNMAATNSQQNNVTSNNSWPAAAVAAQSDTTSIESMDQSASLTARAPPGLVPSSPWLQQPPAFNRSTSWTPQSSFGELPTAAFYYSFSFGDSWTIRFWRSGVKVKVKVGTRLGIITNVELEVSWSNLCAYNNDDDDARQGWLTVDLTNPTIKEKLYRPT